jgi:uncharacterized protein
MVKIWTILNNKLDPPYTLVMGASLNSHRYSHLAVLRLQEMDKPVLAIGKRTGQIGKTMVSLTLPGDNLVHTATLYLNAENQKEYYSFLLQSGIKRVIFNPGAENPDLEEQLKQKGIETLRACTLVMLSTGQF